MSIRDVVDVTDVWYAAFLNYLGYQVMKVVAPDRYRTVWTFQIPECDAEICGQQYVDDTVTWTGVSAFVRAIKHVQYTQGLARRFGGEYISPEWRRIVATN